MPADDFFFLSYARKDEENREHIGQFFDDLRERIRGVHGSVDGPEDHIGFIDQEMRPGTNWRLTLGDALASCKALVCLYSPRYFSRPYCGKEVSVFLDRRKNQGGNPPVIIPVIWREPNSVPEELAEFQSHNRSLPQAYKDHGLRKLIVQQQKYSTEYDDFVEAMAKWVVDTYKYNLPSSAQPPNLDAIEPVFPRVALQAVQPAAANGAPSGPKSVKFAYVAREEPWKWQPFPPDPIGIVAASTASERGFFPDVFPFTLAFADDLKRAKQSNSLVVFLIDSGAVDLPEWRPRLTEFDDTNFFNCGTMVVWPAGGPTGAVLDKMRTQVFDDNYRRNYPKFFRDDIDSLSLLRSTLAELLETLKMSVINQAQPVRPTQPSSFTPSGAL